jgi:16S rRNA (cytosine967-C5)-methyltransferase
MSANSKAPNIRRLALDIVSRCLDATDGEGGYSNILIDSAMRRWDLPDRDGALLSWLVATVLERRITLDHIISQLSSRPAEELDPGVMSALRLGICQLRYSDRIPAHAAVNETVGLVRPSARGFVNALLRAYLRKRDRLSFPGPGDAGYLSVTYSVPEELCSALGDAYGDVTAESILKAYLRVPALTLRTNTLRLDRDGLIARLAARGISAEPCADSPCGLRLAPGSGLPDEVNDGLAYVQDESSQICADVLGAGQGDRVLDACACPGSKSFYAAIAMKDRGAVVSCDVHASKLPLVAAGAARLGIGIISTVCRDSSVPAPEYAGAFDRVLCDVPCSGLGAIAGKPELRYRAASRIAGLPELQYSILSACSEAVRPGGTLVYSTCTLLPEENGRVVERFLGTHPDFAPDPFRRGSLEAPQGTLTILPDQVRDGFFIARLSRRTGAGS